MVDCKSVSTSMELNFKKLCGSVVGPELANRSEYQQLVGALMFLVNSDFGHMFHCKYFESIYGLAYHIHWIAS